MTELCCYMTLCAMDLGHKFLAYKNAMNNNYKMNNFITAANFARLILELEPTGVRWKCFCKVKYRYSLQNQRRCRRWRNTTRLSRPRGPMPWSWTLTHRWTPSFKRSTGICAQRHWPRWRMRDRSACSNALCVRVCTRRAPKRWAASVTTAGFASLARMPWDSTTWLKSTLPDYSFCVILHFACIERKCANLSNITQNTFLSNK